MTRKTFLCLLFTLFVLAPYTSLYAGSTATSPKMCAKRLNVRMGSQSFAIPYCRSRALSDGHSTATRAVIVIQSSSLNASDVYDWMWEAAGNAYRQASTVVFAPQFPVKKDIAAYHLEGNVPVWDDWDWAVGGMSLKLSGARSTRISSFDVTDQLIRALYNRTKFPRLRHVVVVGQSAGGQFANRYAITNGLHEVARTKDLNLRYVVMNPSHYLYLDNKRPSPVDGRFRVPNANFFLALNRSLPAGETPHDPNSSDCRNYNDYPKGLDDLWTYPARRSLDTIRRNYKSRDARYLIGALDNDRNGAGLSKNCSSDVQGLTRLTRAHLYWGHLKNVYGDSVTRYQRIVKVPGIGHGGENMFKHPLGGLRHVFDYR